MGNKPDIIPYDKDAHYSFAKKWWGMYYDGDIVPSDCLPDTGAVALCGDRPAAMAFIYRSNSKMCTIHFSMADPDLGPTNRYKFIKAAVSAAIEMAREFVGNDGFIWTYTHNAVVARIFKDNGMKCVGEADAFVMPFGNRDPSFLEEE